MTIETKLDEDCTPPSARLAASVAKMEQHPGVAEMCNKVYAIRLGRFHGAQADLCPAANTIGIPFPAVYMTRLIVPAAYRRRGHGSLLLEMVKSDAIRLGVVVMLFPSAYDEPNALTQKELVSFYQKRGFIQPVESNPVLAFVPKACKEAFEAYVEELRMIEKNLG